MSKRSVLYFFTVLLFSSTLVYSSPLDSVGMTKVNNKMMLRYMVSSGETIYKISTKYKTQVSDLLEINPELENGLKTGQIINIPYNDGSQSVEEEDNAEVIFPKTETVKATVVNKDSIEDGKKVHTVQAGETYFSLAKKYNISVGELMKINNVELKTGQKIIVTTSEPTQEEIIKANNTPKTPTKAPVVNNVVPKPTPAQVEKNEEKAIFKTLPENKPIEPTNNIVENNGLKKLLVIPFDPYLYFSDADDEIAAVSKMNRTKVRQSFRRRLNALLEPPGYETIQLLGGKAIDSVSDLNRIYRSISYSYQNVIHQNIPNHETQTKKGQIVKNKTEKPSSIGGWMQKKKEPVTEKNPFQETSRASQATDANKYFGVKINNPDFYTFFNNKYNVDYYLFISQFEVKTNYENCLDRAALNYERGFITHFSIFDKTGKQIAGNRIYTDYNSNSNNIEKILTDNVPKIANRIMAELPKQ